MTSYLDELFSLAGRTAVVTGGNSGIGLGIARALGQAGAAVVLLARDAGRLEQAAADLGAAGVTAAWVQADILVNCAGVNIRPPLDVLTLEQWDVTMAVNLTAPFLLGQWFGPSMARRGWGRIINITSQQASRAFLNSGGYGASKGGLAALTRSQSEAWAPSGVCCNAVSPGFVPSAMNAHLSADPALPDALAARTMIKRNSRPGDFAGTAVFLASPASEYVTGQVLHVDGGFSVT